MDKVLAIEDNKDYQNLIQQALGADFQLVFADNGQDGIRLATEHKPDLILLDISLGGMDGFEVCHILKKKPETQITPVIFLSSRADTHSKVMGFDLGADDYIQKPFDTDELKARVKTRIKQSQARRETVSTFELQGLRIDFLGHRVYIDNKEVPFSALEFKLLSYFVRHPDRVLSRQRILNQVWGMDTFVTDRVVDSHIRSIRKKLGAYKEHIESIYGEGYRFNPKVMLQNEDITSQAA